MAGEWVRESFENCDAVFAALSALARQRGDEAIEVVVRGDGRVDIYGVGRRDYTNWLAHADTAEGSALPLPSAELEKARKPAPSPPGGKET